MLEQNIQFPNSENKSSFLSALIQLYQSKVRNIGEVYKDKVISANRMNRQGEPTVPLLVITKLVI